MESIPIDESLIVLLIGGLVVLCVLLYAQGRRLGIPPLVGFILLGFALRVADMQFELLTRGVLEIIDILGKIGVIALLFRIGLESDLQGLLGKIRSASLIWIVSVLGSGLVGFVAARWVLDASLPASLFVAVAMTATSVGASVGVWKDAGKLSTESGELLLDVVELDDLSGVVLMSILFGIAPTLFGHGTGPPAADSSVLTVVVQLLTVLGKLAAFFAACYLFMRFVERPLTRLVEKLEKGPEPMLTMVGVSFVIAAFAGRLGFSVAIGGFFAGLIFSQDRDAVRMKASYRPLYEFFVPFFFIFIGVSIPAAAAVKAVIPGLVLLGAAVIGKLLFSWLPALAVTRGHAALVIGISMIPRAEITMIILQQGRSFETVDIPADIYNGMIVVVLATVTLTPLVLRSMLPKVKE